MGFSEMELYLFSFLFPGNNQFSSYLEAYDDRTKQLAGRSEKTQAQSLRFILDQGTQ